jgi:predicted peptidase
MPARKQTTSPLEEKSFKKRVVRQVGLRYLLSLPRGYDRAPSRRWPLVLFLHGAGERGDDLQLVKKHGIPRVTEERRVPGFEDLPFISISPQCPTESWWARETLALSALLDEIEGTYRVDPDRIYVTGLSMGGFGTFALAAAEPDRFAALAPICGGGSRTDARHIAHIPLWVFHGAKDQTVPLFSSAEMVEAIALRGGSPRFTVYPDATHDSWTETYDNPDLYRWLLSHTRTPAKPVQRGAATKR